MRTGTHVDGTSSLLTDWLPSVRTLVTVIPGRVIPLYPKPQEL